MHAGTTEQRTKRVYASVPGETDRAARRRRLERFASLLEQAHEPLRLFVAMECYPRRERLALRQPCSPLTLAFHDAQFRREGLAGDRVGDAIAFFNLSLSEAHALLCDCRYGDFSLSGQPLPQRIARRARKLAAKRNLEEWRMAVSAWLGAGAAHLRQIIAMEGQAAHPEGPPPSS